MRTSTLTPDQIIPRRILSNLATGEITLTAAIKQSKMHKNAFFRSVAKMIKAGQAPDSLLDFKSIASIHDQLENVYAPTIVGSSEREIEKLRGKLSDAQRRAREAEQRLETDQ
ncbi:hypothetical protein K3758_05050 [Sulfitobacter sp. W002]|uniref:hypothetical protein n=1 Tax=Sulfitobacter sp. W002 TaxID=2867024 RepID=UPI0021A478EB|nr:hypothetical protein [Sulfitobacter sp. W002]UWR30902.1 hypothetical protein K3758_05050 [Sulfitobacter sp. W002]